MVVSSFEQMPAAGLPHKACRHLVDRLASAGGAKEAARPVMHWCTSHTESTGLMCADDARRHEDEADHGDASFTNEGSLPAGVEVVDEDGRRFVLGPDGVTVALMVFYAD